MSENKLLTSSQYRLFRSWVAQQRVIVTDPQPSDGSAPRETTWRYYSYGPKNQTPLVILGGICGTAESFYSQFVSLAPKGYHLIAVQSGPYWDHADWVQAFDRFLDKLEVDRVHLLGCQLGGLLAQLYSQARPLRVESMILCNTFCDTQYFFDRSFPAALLPYTPEFLVKRAVLQSLPQSTVDSHIADAIDFLVQEIEDSPRVEIASRLALTTKLITVDPQHLMDNSRVTLILTADGGVQPESLAEELRKFYPEARVAEMKSGGDFPWIAFPEEFNLFLEVHLRRFGLASSSPAAASSSVVSPFAPSTSTTVTTTSTTVTTTTTTTSTEDVVVASSPAAAEDDETSEFSEFKPITDEFKPMSHQPPPLPQDDEEADAVAPSRMTQEETQ